MKAIKFIIKWFNGKKTIIGLMGTTFMQMDLIFLQNMNPDIKNIGLWLFGLLAGSGLIHKAIKKPV